jgi:molybdopterin molybdotransferase
VLRPVAPGENLVTAGEDVKTGEPLFPAGHLLRPQDIGGLLALGITHVSVAVRPRVAIISTGDEIIPPEAVPRPGQVRDVNTYTVAGLVTEAGGISLPGGIVPDDYEALLGATRAALGRADVLVLSAGSSVSTRDFTADVVNELGRPGVLVHGVALKPGKPTILGICAGRPVLGLPGNPVSAMVAAGLFLRPLLAHLQGMTGPPAGRYVAATLARNVSSQAGREDHVPVRIVEQDGEVWAEPVLGKSNLIYTLVRADGTIEVPLDANGLHRGDPVRVRMF